MSASVEWSALCQRRVHEFIEPGDDRTVVNIEGIEDVKHLVFDLSAPSATPSVEEAKRNLLVSLDRLGRFVHSLAIASRSTDVGRILLCGIQTVLQSVSKVPHNLRNILDILTELNDVLPDLTVHTHLLPGSLKVQWAIQDITNEYLDYCMVIVRHVGDESSVDAPQFFWSTSPSIALHRTKSKIAQLREALVAELDSLEDLVNNGSHNGLAEAVGPLQSSKMRDPMFAAILEQRRAVCNVETDRDSIFMGQELLLEKLSKCFETEKISSPPADNSSRSADCIAAIRHLPNVCQIRGGGGLGKTRAAIRFVELHRPKYDTVLWLSADNEAQLQSSINQCVKLLQLFTDVEIHDDKSKLEVFAKWLEHTALRWLLVFDNVGDTVTMASYIPLSCSARSSVLITSPSDSVYGDSSVHTILPLDLVEGVRLLFRYAGRPASGTNEELMAREFVEMVEGSPLGLAVIGRSMQDQRCQVQDILTKLKDSISIWTAKVLTNGSNLTKADFQLTSCNLSDGDRTVLDILAFFDGECIPEDIFRNNLQASTGGLVESKERFIEHLQILHGRRLISKRMSDELGTYYTMHRILSRLILLNICKDPAYRERCSHAAMGLLRHCCPITSPMDIPEPDKNFELEKYDMQIQSVLKKCLWPAPALQPSSAFAKLMSDLSTYSWHAGHIEAGCRALETVIKVYDQAQLPADDERRADLYARQGRLVSFKGVTQRAETLDCRFNAIEIQRKVFDRIPLELRTREDEVRRQNVNSDLAFQYIHEEKFSQIEQIMEGCLREYQKWEPSEDKIPFEYGKYYFLISFVRMWQGRKADAMFCAQRATRLLELAAGEDHPITQIWRFALGTIAYHTGDVMRAWEINEAVRQVRIRISGEANHHTLESYSACGALLCKLRKHRDAEYIHSPKLYLETTDNYRAVLRRCLERSSQCRWYPEGLARAKFRLSQVLRQLGRDDEANKYSCQAMKTVEWVRIECPDQLHADPDDLEAVFDEIVPMWAGRLTGKLRDSDQDN